jgi:hypothetical protein
MNAVLPAPRGPERPIVTGILSKERAKDDPAASVAVSAAVRSKTLSIIDGKM